MPHYEEPEGRPLRHSNPFPRHLKPVDERSSAQEAQGLTTSATSTQHTLLRKALTDEHSPDLAHDVDSVVWVDDVAAVFGSENLRNEHPREAIDEFDHFVGVVIRDKAHCTVSLLIPDWQQPDLRYGF